MQAKRLCLIDAVGLSPRHPGATMPRLSALIEAGQMGPLAGVVPAVTCSAQATILSGLAPSGHGIVGNGWLFRETMEARFWQQNNGLIQAEPVYRTAARRARALGRDFRSAKLFWWFNQGAGVDFSLTPKPFYGSDGSKHFAIQSDPPDLAPEIEAALGDFPFFSFWGPKAGLPSSDWIARATARLLREEKPELSFCYLPHLDYDLQRFGPEPPHLDRLLGELDSCIGLVVDACEESEITPVVLSEYGIEAVDRAVLPNRALREAGLLQVRRGPFGEQLEPYQSRAFAICDHQIAHVHVGDPSDEARVREILTELPGVAEVLDGPQRALYDLDHPRSGELVLLAEAGSWFAYNFWLDDQDAPDYARTVDIHRKPGYDPCELFLDPSRPAMPLRAAGRVLQKKLGLRYRMDVIGLDPSIVRGSHGRPPVSPDHGPIWVGPTGRAPSDMASIRDWILEFLDLGEEA